MRLFQEISSRTFMPQSHPQRFVMAVPKAPMAPRWRPSIRRLCHFQRRAQVHVALPIRGEPLAGSRFTNEIAALTSTLVCLGWLAGSKVRLGRKRLIGAVDDLSL
jgi:hypothetical protein